jgi:hypothetical protein
MARQTGINSTTYKKFFLDAGKLYSNYGEASQAVIGATRGGNTFTIETEYRQMEVDGAHGPVKGDKRITNVVATLQANIIEMSKEVFLRAISAATATDEGTYDKITRTDDIADSDYTTNLALVGNTTVGATDYMAVIIKNALSTDNFELSYSDKDESVLSVTWTGHFLPTDLETEPWEIRVPK